MLMVTMSMNAPWVRVVLRKLELVLRNNVGELVEDDEPHRAVIYPG